MIWHSFALLLTLLLWTLHDCCCNCNCEQIPLDQVHKYLELLNRQQDDDDRRGKDLPSTETASVVSVTSVATTTSNAASVSLSTTASDTEKTDVTQSPAADCRYVTT